MRRIVTLSFSLLALVVVTARSSTAAAQMAEAASAPTASASSGGGHGFGLGAQLMSHTVGTLSGFQLAYDPGPWHVEGIVDIADPAGDDNTFLGVGARFWW